MLYYLVKTLEGWKLVSQFGLKKVLKQGCDVIKFRSFYEAREYFANMDEGFSYAELMADSEKL